jgi:hypothetical protein
VPSKTDSGFTFVDVAPDSPVFKPGNKPRENPPTYTIVTREEITALTGEDDEEADSVLGDWRTARNDARNLRRAPKAA